MWCRLPRIRLREPREPTPSRPLYLFGKSFEDGLERGIPGDGARESSSIPTAIRNFSFRAILAATLTDCFGPERRLPNGLTPPVRLSRAAYAPQSLAFFFTGLV